MRIIAFAAAAVLLLTGTAADAKHRYQRHPRHHHMVVDAVGNQIRHIAAATNGHLLPDNNGKMVWVSDANTAYAGRQSRHASARVSRQGHGDIAEPKQRTTDLPKGDVSLSHNGMVTVTTAQGFTITVHPAYAAKFLRFFALLKEHGYKVPANITRCWAPHGTHVPGSNHYIGAACDIQTGWNRGPSFVYHMDGIIREAGLYSGCSFHDCGHVEAVRGTHNQPPNLYASLEKFKSLQSTMRYQP